MDADLARAMDAAKYVAKYATKDGGRKRCSNAYGLSGIRSLIKNHERKLYVIFEHFPGYEIISVSDDWGRYPDRLLRRCLNSVRQPSDMHPVQCDDQRWSELREIEDRVRQSLAQQRGRILALTGLDAPAYLGWSTGRKIELLASVDRDPFIPNESEV